MLRCYMLLPAELKHILQIQIIALLLLMHQILTNRFFYADSDCILISFTTLTKC